MQVNIYDAVGAQPLRNLGAEYPYLRRRLETGLRFINLTGFTVPDIVEKHPVAGDVTSVRLSILPVNLGKGRDDYALSLATAAHAQKNGLNKLIPRIGCRSTDSRWSPALSMTRTATVWRQTLTHSKRSARAPERCRTAVVSGAGG